MSDFVSIMVEDLGTVKDYYSEWWENPNIRTVVTEKKLNRLVRKRTPKGEGKKALDTGSGRGRIVSYLLEKGYEVTSVEFNEQFAHSLRQKYPDIHVLDEDVRHVKFTEDFDVVTCIQLAQNLQQAELEALTTTISKITKLVYINISNVKSFHGFWVQHRGFQAGFVFKQSPKDFRDAYCQAGFGITYRRGIGLITPVSLFPAFKAKIIPIWFARGINAFDCLARWCHLYYIEAIRRGTKL